MDDYFSLLNQALGQRQSIWMFYTIIVTTAIGTAFTDNYRKFGVWPRILLTIAVGAAVWFNFYSAIINSMYIHELVSIIKENIEDTDNLRRIFFNEKFYNQEDQMFSAIFYIYLPINAAVFLAMWWDEFLILRGNMKKKFSKVRNDDDIFS